MYIFCNLTTQYLRTFFASDFVLVQTKCKVTHIYNMEINGQSTNHALGITITCKYLKVPFMLLASQEIQEHVKTYNYMHSVLHF